MKVFAHIISQHLLVLGVEIPLPLSLAFFDSKIVWLVQILRMPLYEVIISSIFVKMKFIYLVVCFVRIHSKINAAISY